MNKDIDAICIVRQMVADGQISQEVAEKYFPELKESIDERVKKVIRQVLNESTTEKDECYSDNGVTQQEVFAWLENPTDNDIKEALRTEYEKGRADAMAEVQKSAWSEDGDDNMLMIEDRLSDYLDYIREDSSITKHRKNSLKEEVIGYVKWLKSLKGRMQPQNTWKPSDAQMNNK